jgi:hypothetical protein
MNSTEYMCVFGVNKLDQFLTGSQGFTIFRQLWPSLECTRPMFSNKSECSCDNKLNAHTTYPQI